MMDDMTAEYNILIATIKIRHIRQLATLLRVISPNIVNERGWSGLHEAVACESMECFKLLLNHPLINPLVMTREGESVLYTACEHRFFPAIEMLLKRCRVLVNRGNRDGLTPLHLASMGLNADLVQLLLDYGADVNSQTRDGETPLLKACFNGLQNLQKSVHVTNLLLHAGADIEMGNRKNVTPIHITCHLGFVDLFKVLIPFLGNLNCRGSVALSTPLMCAVESVSILKILLEMGADPDLHNLNGETALDIALERGCIDSVIVLLQVTNKKSLDSEFILNTCKTSYFCIDVLNGILNLELGPEFFDFNEMFYTVLEKAGPISVRYPLKSPLDTYLHLCEDVYKKASDKFNELLYLFLMRGVSVNALEYECPPLVFLHVCPHSLCFDKVFTILMEHDCDVDFRTNQVLLYGEYYLPDAFAVALTLDPTTIPKMLPYSLQCEPSVVLQFAHDHRLLNKMLPSVQEELLKKICVDFVCFDSMSTMIPTLKHMCRMKIRSTLRKTDIKTTKDFLKALNKLFLPRAIEIYLRYI